MRVTIPLLTLSTLVLWSTVGQLVNTIAQAIATLN